MQNIFQVAKGEESLVAKLIRDDVRSIELTYTNFRGAQYISLIRDGTEISTRGVSDGQTPVLTNRDGNTYIPGCGSGIRRLGPELREQIPTDWYEVLGQILTPD